MANKANRVHPNLTMYDVSPIFCRALILPRIQLFKKCVLVGIVQSHHDRTQNEQTVSVHDECDSLDNHLAKLLCWIIPRDHRCSGVQFRGLNTNDSKEIRVDAM